MAGIAKLKFGDPLEPIYDAPGSRREHAIRGADSPEVLIVNSPLFRDSNSLYDEDSLPPIGLGYVATALRQAGISVALVDAIADRLGLDQLVDLILETQPRLLATNVFTTNYDLVQELVERIALAVPHIVVGGLSTRTLHLKIFGWKVDGQLDVVFGDGEQIIVPIATNTLAEPPALQMPRRRFFKVDTASRYYLPDISGVPLDRAFFSNEPIHHPLGFDEAHLVASRGCIYNCSFCAAARSMNRDLGVRERAIEDIQNELAHLQQQFSGLNSIRILDDLFLKNSGSITRAIETFTPFPFRWRSMAHVLTFDGVDASILDKLYGSGCRELFIGIESGSERILRMIHKTADVMRIQRNLESVLRAGISIKGYFIYGFPEETLEDCEATYRLACALKEISLRCGTSFRTSVFQFRPYHGTELYHSILAQGTPEESVLQVKPDPALSALVGRLQFNFHSGNYSKVDSETIRAYIYKTANLSDRQQWGL